MNISGSLVAGVSRTDIEKPSPLEPLGVALVKGDLTAASNAFDKLQKSGRSTGPKPGVQVGSDNDADDNMTSLGDALQAGNLTAARKAYGKLANSSMDPRASASNRKKIHTDPLPPVQISPALTANGNREKDPVHTSPLPPVRVFISDDQAGIDLSA